jgi:hypothetical protein
MKKIINSYKTINVDVCCPLCNGKGQYKAEVKINTTREEMLAMREAGATLEEIAKAFNTVISNVNYHLGKVEEIPGFEGTRESLAKL